MKVIASRDEYTIYQRRDGRYAVKGADKTAINGDAKVGILLQHELITAAAPKASEPEPGERVESQPIEANEEESESPDTPEEA